MYTPFRNEEIRQELGRRRIVAAVLRPKQCEECDLDFRAAGA